MFAIAYDILDNLVFKSYILITCQRSNDLPFQYMDKVKKNENQVFRFSPGLGQIVYGIFLQRA